MIAFRDAQSMMCSSWYEPDADAMGWCPFSKGFTLIRSRASIRSTFGYPKDFAQTGSNRPIGQSPSQPSHLWSRSRLRSDWIHPKSPAQLAFACPTPSRRCPRPVWLKWGLCEELPPSRFSVMPLQDTAGTGSVEPLAGEAFACAAFFCVACAAFFCVACAAFFLVSAFFL